MNKQKCKNDSVLKFIEIIKITRKTNKRKFVAKTIATTDIHKKSIGFGHQLKAYVRNEKKKNGEFKIIAYKTKLR